MIEIRRKDLNRSNLDDLLSIKIDKIVSEYISSVVKHGIGTSQESVNDLKNFLTRSEFLSFLDDGRLDYYGAKLSSLTIIDLIDNRVLDEEFGVYHVSYDSHQDFYGVECRLLGIYSSLSAVQSQIDRLKNGEDQSKVVDVNELDIKFVSLDNIVDVYLDGYIE